MAHLFAALLFVGSLPLARAAGAAADSPTVPPNVVIKQQAWLNTSCYGVWDRDGRFLKKDRPFLKGKAAGIKWYELEPTEGNLNLQLLNASLFSAAQMGECWYAMVHVGPDSPNWIYSRVPDTGRVPGVEVQEDDKHSFQYPYYLDENYKQLWFRMLKAVADYIRGLPTWMTDFVGFIQVTTGCTGDEIAYKKPPKLAKYMISDPEQWDVFRLEAFGKFHEYFQTGAGRTFPLLFNNVDEAEHPTVWPWLITHIDKGLGIKGSAFVRGHHLSEESSWIKLFQKYMINPAPNDPLIFTRAEMDQTYSNPFFQINVQLGIYWGVLSGLNQGLAVHDVSLVPLTNADKWGITDSYEFFSAYAGQIFPSTATRAFVALHEGLSAEDPIKFPEQKFGTVLRSNGGILKTSQRLVAICDYYKDFGCQMDDLNAAMLGQVYQRESQKGYNDAGWFIQAGNYHRFLEQIDADNTSQGWFRIGGQITNRTPRYARFGRGLLHAANKTGLYFKLADGFFSKTPVGSLSFHVIWYDKYAGSWQFEYTTKASAKKIGFNQVSVGDGTWKDATFQLDDAAMNRTYTRGSDFGIVSNTGTDLIFHMIEVVRGASPTFDKIDGEVMPVVLDPTTTTLDTTTISTDEVTTSILTGVASYAFRCSPGYFALAMSILTLVVPLVLLSAS